MSRIAFLSIEDLTNYVCDDELVVQYLQENGWHVEIIAWRRSGVDWRVFDAVVIRSTWDYQEAPYDFFEVLRCIECTGVPLLNSLSLVKWNLNKVYLRDLAGQGIPIVPTIWGDVDLMQTQVFQAFREFNTSELILKPVISANADHTHRLRLENVVERWPVLANAYRDRAFMLQPFIPEILHEGEYSLFFFDGKYSHAILKKLRTGDFRVQEEHGGQIVACEPPEGLQEQSLRILEQLPELPFQARVDWVREHPEKNQFMVMELELIEPSLYFRFSGTAVANFTHALQRRLARQ